MVGGLLDAIITDGEMKGWPLRAALSLGPFVSKADAKAALIREYEDRKAASSSSFDKAISEIKSLSED